MEAETLFLDQLKELVQQMKRLNDNLDRIIYLDGYGNFFIRTKANF